MNAGKPTNQKTFTLQQLAGITQSELVGDPNHEIQNAAPLEQAGPQDVSFLANPKYQPVRYLKAMQASHAGAVFIAPEVEVEQGKNYLIHPDPSCAFQIVLEEFYETPELLSAYTDIHPTAVVHETAKIGNNVTIGPNAVVDKDVQIGSGTFIGAGSYIGPHAEIGIDCIIHPNATIRENCHLGDRVIIQPGAVIGSCGFGYTQDPQGRHTKLKHFGPVVLGNDVEIGANTTIDRGRFTETSVGNGTKIDNLVQIAHSVQIGRNTLIMAQAGIAGSTKIGNHVILAGQVGANGHIEICDRVLVSAKSGITKSITKPGKYGGLPAVPLNEYNRSMVHFRNLDKIIKKLKE